MLICGNKMIRIIIDMKKILGRKGWSLLFNVKVRFLLDVKGL